MRELNKNAWVFEMTFFFREIYADYYERIKHLNLQEDHYV